MDSLHPSQRIDTRIDQYLTEVEDELFKAISENKNTLISADPASGKTTLFAHLCANHVNDQKTSRIVFCAPYLIIQEQFKQRLLSRKVEVDFELNGQNPRKKLQEGDRIITSTFKSFSKISEQLSPEDIVIIDEAHSLLTVFSNQKGDKHDHHADFYKALYFGKAKVVLMTGTPVDSLYGLFDPLLEIRIAKNSAKARVNLHYSSYRLNDVVSQFANECINTYGRESLNIIYIKNKSKCDLFSDIIRDLGYSSLVLTSDNKASDAYRMLVEKSLISREYQFLITTNVISTGTNILNDNIGKALMLHEYDPIEIKQFSKRFRNKLDIEIDVVNPAPSAQLDWNAQRNELLRRRAINRNYLEHVRAELNDLFNEESVKVLSFNAFGGDASQLNPIIRRNAYIKRNLLQEIYFHQELTKTYYDGSELAKALNEFDDIFSVEVPGYEIGSNDPIFDEDAYLEDQQQQFHRLITNFIEQPEPFLLAYSIHIDQHHRYSKLREIKLILSNLELNDHTYQEAINIRIDPRSLKTLISPLVEYYHLFLLKDYKTALIRCLRFLRDVPLNKQSKYTVALWFNKEFHEHFSVPEDYGHESDSLLTKPGGIIPNNDIVYFLLNQTFKFIMSHDEIYYPDFTSFVFNTKYNKGFNPDKYFPWTDQLTFLRGKIVAMNKNFGLGLLYSIFAINSRQEQKNHPRVPDKNRVQTLIPSNWHSIHRYDFLNEDELNTFNNGLRIMRTWLPTYSFKGINLNATERVIIDRNYVTLMAAHSNDK